MNVVDRLCALVGFDRRLRTKLGVGDRRGAMRLTTNHRRFHLRRDVDVTGTSGTGERVAEGCQFSNGAVVLEWLSACASTNRYGNVQALMQVHGHGGATRLVWDDPDALGT